MRNRFQPILFLCIAALIAVVVRAAGSGENPRGLPYRGHLDLGGVPITDSLSMTFVVWDDAAAGTALHTETLDVDIAGGDFSVVLGRGGVGLSDEVFSAAELFISVSVAGTPLDGRQQIWALPQAQRAARAQNLTVTGDLEVQGGTIWQGAPPTVAGTDLGLYSAVDGKQIRVVSNAAPIRFFTDGATSDGYGGTAALAVEADGRLIANGPVLGALTDVTTEALNANQNAPRTATTNLFVTVMLEALNNGARGFCVVGVRLPGGAWATVARGSVHYFTNTDNHVQRDSMTVPIAAGDEWYVDCTDTSLNVDYQVMQRTIMQ